MIVREFLHMPDYQSSENPLASVCFVFTDIQPILLTMDNSMISIIGINPAAIENAQYSIIKVCAAVINQNSGCVA